MWESKADRFSTLLNTEGTQPANRLQNGQAYCVVIKVESRFDDASIQMFLPIHHSTVLPTHRRILVDSSDPFIAVTSLSHLDDATLRARVLLLF